MGRFAALAATGDKPIRLNNISSQIRYASSSRSERGGPSKPSLPNHLLAFPIIAFGERVGVVCCEEAESGGEAFGRLDDRYLAKLSIRLGEALAAMPGADPRQREDRLRQVVERTGLEWEKSTEPFHSLLSARERQVAMQVATGLTNGDIAKQLYISVRTVTTHLERIFLKLNVTSRAALTRYVVEKGLLTDDADRLQP
ncbi:response regulator transcription factor [Cohnella cholangitidis]|uniref:Response regulator transcription factor n=1 Tax=Cohnella cholangitidis TaxID=2598458 RepID=A0A7G5BZ51_9BACL|nr:LuxR C-terminal-related transcriptional regulator [Cohnella cholangitidis]QMV42235.1 response regulator transcription factor [Cohnella cholangitidis]